MSKSRILITTHVDLSEAFVDSNGSFYAGTTAEQLARAAELAGIADWNLFCSDLHPISSPEFVINGGLYPIHNVPRPDELDLEKYNLMGRTASPKLTAAVHEAVDKTSIGVFVPRQVYFQEADGTLSFTPDDIEATYNARIITDKQFLDGEYTYIIQPKYFFDATRLTINPVISRQADEPRIPEKNQNVFGLIKLKYARDTDLVFIIPSVVENICTHHTAAGIRQDFPEARVIIPSDAITPLAGVGLGFEKPEDVGSACRALAVDIGIEYKTTEEIRAEFGR